MDVRNCRQCGRLFNYLGGPPICQACREAVEEKFQQVKEYVRNNPGSNIQMVAEDNDVTVQQIRQWIREERLEFSADSQVGIECEGCGASIRTGRFCDAFLKKINMSRIIPLFTRLEKGYFCVFLVYSPCEVAPRFDYVIM